MSELQNLAEWAKASIRDEIGPEAAAVVAVIDTDLVLYGRVQDETYMALDDLGHDDRAKVLGFLVASSRNTRSGA